LQNFFSQTKVQVLDCTERCGSQPNIHSATVVFTARAAMLALY